MRGPIELVDRLLPPTRAAVFFGPHPDDGHHWFGRPIIARWCPEIARHPRVSAWRSSTSATWPTVPHRETRKLRPHDGRRRRRQAFFPPASKKEKPTGEFKVRPEMARRSCGRAWGARRAQVSTRTRFRNVVVAGSPGPVFPDRSLPGRSRHPPRRSAPPQPAHQPRRPGGCWVCVAEAARETGLRTCAPGSLDRARGRLGTSLGAGDGFSGRYSLAAISLVR